jgi:hypothetical protein
MLRFVRNMAALWLALAIIAPAAHAQCVSLTTLGAATSQSFDTLSNTAGSTTNNLTITGWFMTESGGGARDNEQYAVDTGASNTGDTYSYGSAAATDRALGGLQSGTLIPIFGACFTNNTGSAIANFAVAYTGEQWRLGTVARTDQINFEYSTNATDLVTGTWTGVAALNFVTPFTTTVGATNGNAAANRTALSNTVTPPSSIANGATFWIRWTDTNATGADDGLSVDDFSLTPNGAAPVVNLSINDVTVTEGNAGTVTAAFTVSLSAPAGAGGVTFDIGTANNTATTANNDYVANTLTGQTIPAGSSTYTFNVLVNGDATPEANETFFVNVTNVTGATVIDGQGTGTINNDDVAVTPIHDIQGPGASSPIVGASVTVRGIVTGIRSNAFFVQEPEANYDADPATSEGILVFVGAAPPAAAAVGNLVQVTGTVTEFVPTADPLQPPLTEITAPTVTQLSTGNPLPAAIPLSATFPDPAGAHDQLERVEGMRVSLAALTVGGPTLGNVSEANATATSNGVFYGTVTGVPRAFREAGIQQPDPPPAGTIPPIPRWDHNPEVIRVDSDGQTGAAQINVATGATVNNLIGPLDYTFRYYTILPDPASPPTAAGGVAATAVAAPTSSEFTVASYNLQRFFDTVNDPGIGEPVLTATAYNNRLNKASLGIRNFLRAPDILAVVEVENLTTLQDLATRINNDAVAASQPNPLYQAFLVEGNDVGGIDVGFLIKTAIVAGSTPRVSVTSVTQRLAGTLFTNPDSSTELLNDRPPLELVGAVNHPSGASFPLTVVVNHLRSLNGVGDLGAGSNGWATAGERVRAKRHAQAVDLANYVQGMQTADPTRRIVLVGDFNAFEFNDGFGHSMATIAGTPVPDNETVTTGDGVDLVNPDFVNLIASEPANQRYSFVFDGSAQTLDHIIVNQPMIAATAARREEHARINADFPETARNGTTSVERLADHDPVVSYYSVTGFASADVGITKTDSPDPVNAGTNLTYVITASNSGPDPAANANWTDTLPAGTTFVSLTAAAGWSCTTPAIGAGGTVTCNIASFAVGSAGFSMIVNVDAAVAAGTVLTNTATITSTTADPVSGNNSSTTTTTVSAQADVNINKTDAPDPVAPGTNLTYTIAVNNAGPSNAATVSFSDTLPANTAFVSLAAAPGWSCTTPAVGSGGTVSCNVATLAPAGGANFTLVVSVSAAATAGSVISNTVTVASATTDPTPGNNSATATTTVGAGSADLAVTKTDAPDPVVAGQNITYTITASNAGPSNATTATLTDTLPAGTTFVSLSTPAGWTCTTPAVGAGGTVSCSNPSAPLGNAVFSLVTQVSAATAGGTNISNTATVGAATTDPNTGNNSATATTLVNAPASLSATKTVTGAGVQGTNLTYTVIIRNAGPATQGDNPGDEFVDVLPVGLTLVSANATSGTAVATVATRTVTWNGSLAANAQVTITIVATIDNTVGTGVTLNNQGTVNFDGDGNGTNESTALTDNPNTATPNDPTGIVIGGPVVPVPTLSQGGLLALLMMMGMLGAFAARRRV